MNKPFPALAFCVLFAASCATPPTAPPTSDLGLSNNGISDSQTLGHSDSWERLSLSASIASSSAVDPYGSVDLDIPSGRLAEAGFALGDQVRVTIGDHSYSMPLLPHYRLVAPGETVLVAWRDPARPARIAVFYGSFAERSGLFSRKPGTDRPEWTTAAPLPIPIGIELERPGAYRENLHLMDLVRSNDRADYPGLTDADFANFRPVVAPRLRPGALYRSSSPVRSELGRNRFADDAARRVGIRSVVDMADTESAARAADGFAGSYVSTLPAFHRQMGVDFTAPAFGADLADCLRFIASHELPCLLHCKEGQDRTGFACAVLECLFGATPDEVAEDYLRTFRNYYGVLPGSPAEHALRATLLRMLERAFGLSSPLPQDLTVPAREYLLSIGLSAEELGALEAVLRIPEPDAR